MTCEKNTVHLFDHPTQLQMVSANLKLQLNYLDHQFDLTRNKGVDHVKKDVHIMVQRAVIKFVRGCHGRGRDRIVVGFTSTFVISASVPITTNVVSSNSVHGKVFLIKFVSDLRQISSFLVVLRFPPSIKTEHHNITEILMKLALNTITLTLKYVYYHIDKEL